MKNYDRFVLNSMKPTIVGGHTSSANFFTRMMRMIVKMFNRSG